MVITIQNVKNHKVGRGIDKYIPEDVIGKAEATVMFSKSSGLREVKEDGKIDRKSANVRNSRQENRFNCKTNKCKSMRRHEAFTNIDPSLKKKRNIKAMRFPHIF